MLEFYKHITATVYNYIMFVSLLVIAYFLFCLAVSFIAEQIVKIILYIRTPITKSEPDTKDSSN